MATPLRFDLTDTLEAVLSEPRFDTPTESWWDRFLERALTEIARLFAAVIEAIGGPVVAAFVAVGIVGLVALFVAVRLAGRRASTLEDRLVLERLLETGTDPGPFLESAEDASRAGDHSTAVRLRFIGGVLDLARRGRIRYEPGLTTLGIADQVKDEAFDELADQFDLIAYGGGTANRADDEKSQRIWDEIRSGV